MTEASLIAESRCHCDNGMARDAPQVRARHSILLDQLVGLLAAPLESIDGLQKVAQLLVPRLADFIAIDVVADDGTPRRVAVAHATEPEIATLAQHTACDLRDGTYATTLTVLRSGLPYFEEQCDPSGFELFLASAELNDEQKQIARGLRPWSYLAVPLINRGQCRGVMTLLFTAVSMRRYDSGDLILAQHLAGYAAAALEISRLEHGAREALVRQEQLGKERDHGRALESALMDTASGPIVVIDALGRIQRFNAVAQKLSGCSEDDAIGRTFWDMVPTGDVAGVRATLDAVLADGCRNETTTRWLTRPGSHRTLRWTFTPLLGSRQEVAYVVAVGDATDDVARQAAAGAAADRLAQVHRLSVALASARRADDAARTVLAHAQATVGAAAGTVMICSEDGLSLEALGTAGYPEDAVETSLPLNQPVPLVTAVRTGDAILLQSPEESLRAGYAHRADYIQFGHGAWVAVPLKAGDRVLGALGLSFLGPRTFGKDERAFFTVLAEQCAQTVDRLLQDTSRLREPIENSLATALTSREREVLTLLGHGLTNREIAQRLGLGVDTIKTHVAHVGEKLGVVGSARSRVLAIRAVQLGLAPTSPVRGAVTPMGETTWPGFVPTITPMGDSGVWSDA